MTIDRLMLIVVLYLSSGLLSAGPLQAGDHVLRVGTSGDYAPFSLARGDAEGGDPATEFDGFDPAVARAFAHDQGLELRFVRFRWPDLLADLQADRFDLAMSGITVRPERSLAGRFTLPVAISGAVALVRAEHAAMESADLDRPEVRIAVNAGGHLERVARARFARAKIEAIADNRAVIEALLGGRADAAVTDTLEAPHWHARDPSLRQLGPFSRDRKAYLIRSRDDALADRLDAWLLAREADGTLARLRAHYLGPGGGTTRSAEPLHALLAAIDERLALMPLVAEAKRLRGSPIDVPERETKVVETALAAVRAAAPASRRLDEDAVRALFREQIEAAKEIQSAWLAAAAARPDSAAGQTPDLERELRPALIRIGDRIARLLPALPPGLEPDVVAAIARSELQECGLTPARLDAIAKALARVAGGAAPARSDLLPADRYLPAAQ